MSEITIAVDGMSCTGCENRLETNVAEIDGVDRVNADHENRKATIGGDAIDGDSVRATIEELGFEVQE
jgi:copper chaperone